MESPVSSLPEPAATNRERSLGIIATASVVALLYFARDVLVPITLAVILSLLIAPLVRLLRRIGLGQTLSVLAAVLLLTFCFAAIAGVIGSQLARMAGSLPQYERTIQHKLRVLNDATVGKFNALTGQLQRPTVRPAGTVRKESVHRSANQPATLEPSASSAEEAASDQPATAEQAANSQQAASSELSTNSEPSANTEQTADTEHMLNPEPPLGSDLPAAAVQPGTLQSAETLVKPATLARPSNVAKISPLAKPRMLVSAAGSGPVVPIPVELHEPPLNSLQLIEKVLGSIWVPIETAGIVLVVLVFVLLEHEALRDRFIRIAGGTDIRRTTLAINDAGERLSRFFVSQFAVNVGVGVLIWIGLSIISLPHPLLWAALAAVLRFVPYVGIWIAALCAALLAAAVDPGWTLTLEALSLFVIVELIAGQLVEPQLYGHTTGLSPLSVVIAAIFWSWLWGPIGLIVSTPLTLCLLVAGRHIKALSLLDVLLGDTQALTMPERFYQRALSADSNEIIASARVFLKRNSFANYCDLVLLPALHLARIDLAAGTITSDQQMKVRATMVAVIAAIGGHTPPRRHLQSSVLDATTAGRQLRQQREQASGRWQGPLTVPAGSVMLCISLGSIADDLATELLVRILRDQKIDARHVSLDDLEAVPPPNAAEAISIVYVVSAFPSEERERAEATIAEMRRRLPNACMVAVFLPGMLLQPEIDTDGARGADKSATSLGHAVQVCLDLHREKNQK